MPNKKSKPIVVNLPARSKEYATPLAIIVVAISICVAIAFSLSSNRVDVKRSSNGEVSGISDFKLGGIAGNFSTFTEYDNQPCEEDGKPIVLMFSATWCPHCQWVDSTFNQWAKEQTDAIVYRYEIDTGDNPLTDEVETSVPKEHLKIYEAFNPNQSIPTYVFACKYGRIGNGFEGNDNGLQQEIDEFDKLVKEVI